MYHGLLTDIPHAQVQKPQPPKECGLMGTSTSSQVYCHIALQPLGSKQIKNSQLHPGSMARAQGDKNKIITMNQEINWSLSHTDPCCFSLCPLDGGRTPSMKLVQQNPMALYQEVWRECSVHPRFLTTVTKGYRLQFAIKKKPSFQKGHSICSE